MFPNINAECARRGWSRLEFSKKLDVSYGTIKNWLSGATEIPASKVIEMAQLFHCTSDYLLGLDSIRDSA